MAPRGVPDTKTNWPADVGRDVTKELKRTNQFNFWRETSAADNETSAADNEISAADNDCWAFGLLEVWSGLPDEFTVSLQLLRLRHGDSSGTLRKGNVCRWKPLPEV
jgi:hypothetical protein